MSAIGPWSHTTYARWIPEDARARAAPRSGKPGSERPLGAESQGPSGPSERKARARGGPGEESSVEKARIVAELLANHRFPEADEVVALRSGHALAICLRQRRDQLISRGADVP